MSYLRYSSIGGVLGVIVAAVCALLVLILKVYFLAIPVLTVYPFYFLFSGNVDGSVSIHELLKIFYISAACNFILYYIIASLLWLGLRNSRNMWMAPAAYIGFQLLFFSGLWVRFLN